MKVQKILNQYVMQFVDLYHQYKVETEKLKGIKYSICSSLTFYKNTGMIQLSYNDKPGDILPPMSIYQIKNTLDILSGLHPIDVNSINDLYYLSQDKISKLIINENKVQAFDKNGNFFEYDVNQEFDHENLLSKRVSFLIGYMQAEKIVKSAYESREKYRIIRDNITTLGILDLDTHEESIKNPMDILFSDEYKNFSKEDVGRIGYICGQMTKI